MAGAPQDRNAVATRFVADRRRVVGCLFAGAMIAAPFLALLYGQNAGLAAAAAALLATAFLAADAARVAPAGPRKRLRAAAAINGALALACAALLAARLL